MLKIFTGFIYLWIILLWILGGLMHLWTIYIAYSTSGLFWGIVTFFLPVISQIFWGLKAWFNFGFDSPYIQWLIILAAMWLINYIFSMIITIIGSKSENQEA
jgi:hypothetical protein